MSAVPVSRESILDLVRTFAQTSLEPRPFEAGTSTVPVSGKVLTPDDLVALVDSSLDGWLTSGRSPFRAGPRA